MPASQDEMWMVVFGVLLLLVLGIGVALACFYALPVLVSRAEEPRMRQGGRIVAETGSATSKRLSVTGA